MTTTPKTISLTANGLTFSALEVGEGPLVLCLHGFPDSSRSFRAQFAPLARAGYRVVAPMIRGYEPGSQPADNDYHVGSMARDVLGWMDHLGVEKAHLVGHDWGAVIGYATAALAPKRLLSLTTLAVPHLRRFHWGLARVPLQLRKSWYMLFFQLPLLSDAVLERNDYAFIEHLWRTWSPGWEYPVEEMEALKEVFRQPGVTRAALSYYRTFFHPFSMAGRETLRLLTSPIEVPTLALTGTLDGCMDTRLWDRVMDSWDFPVGLRVVRIHDAGHFLHQERPERVNPMILDWLTEH